MTDLHDAFQIAAACRQKKTSPSELLEDCWQRIRASEPEVRAFLCLDEEGSRERAKSLTRSGPPKEGNGRLFGVPIAIKDNISLQGLPMTCGSRILEDYQPIYNATVVDKILAEGGIIIGKTNMDEFAMGSSTEYSAYQLTRNPWDRQRIPGGSSGGSAAAVGVGAVPLALGSDTGGSIRQPASLCGTVGFKPTYGTVSRFGLTAFASSLDQIGPLARNVRDAALLFQVIGGHDPKDSTSIPDSQPDPLKELDQGVKGFTLGIPEEYLSSDVDSEVRTAVEAALEVFTENGATLKRISLRQTAHAIATYYLVANSEASSNLARYDGIRYGPRAESKDLSGTYQGTRESKFGPEVKRRIMLGTFALSSGYYDAYYLKALKARRLIQAEFLQAFQEVDLILGPTSPVPAFRIGEKVTDPLTMYLVDTFTTPSSLAGIPGLSIPCGLTGEGLPVGLQILGPPLADNRVLRAARFYETAMTRDWIAPITRKVLGLAKEMDADEL